MAESIKVTVDKKKKTLTIVMPMNDEPKESASGKSLVLASTHGNLKTDEKYDGKPITIGVNAYVSNK